MKGWVGRNKGRSIAMKTLTIDQRVFKHQDTQTKIKIALFEDDSRVSLDNDADYQFKIKNSSGYLKSETLTIEDDRLVLTTDKFKDLPPDVYSFEVWETEDSIYPSENYGYFKITKNVSEVDGKTISVITIEDFEKRFDEAIKNVKSDKAEIENRLSEQETKISAKADKNELEDKLSQMKLYPEAFENADAIKKTYPDGKPGIFIAVDTGHQWYWVDGAWKDGGSYQTPAPIDDVRNVEAELNSALEGHGLQNLLSLKKSYWGNSQLKADGTWEKGDYWLSSAFTAIKPLHYYSVSTASGYRFLLNVYDKNKAFLYSTQHYTSSNPYTLSQ